MPIPRQQRKTVFGFGEGEAEVVFIKHLLAMYAQQRTITVRIRPAGGKSPGYILTKAIRVRNTVPYDHSFILLDKDIQWTGALKKKAGDGGFELIGSKPCVEGLFLSVLDPHTNHEGRTSSTCKREFEKTHLGANRTINEKDCHKLFTSII